MVVERRRFARHAIHVPVTVSAGVRQDRIGVIRDVSASGMLFHSRTEFGVGERVVLQFRVDRTRGTTAGHVVRVQHDADIHAIFPFITAVRFDAPLLDLPLP